MFLMGDWSDPGTTIITGVDAIGFYLGGWTPHVWTAAQIKAQTVPLMLPIWVYDPNRPGAAQGTLDGDAAVTAMKALGIPPGVRCALDMETYADAPYVQAFRDVIASAGYWTTIYGSAGTLFGNYAHASGPGGGWWVANYTETEFMYDHVGTWATQYHQGSKGNPVWDLSAVTVLDHLWAHIPAKFTLSVSASAVEGSASKSAAFVVG